MELIDVIIWLFVILSFVCGLIYYGMRPEKCPKCGKRMKYECRAREGKETCLQVCPDCGYEIILNEE